MMSVRMLVSAAPNRYAPDAVPEYRYVDAPPRACQIGDQAALGGIITRSHVTCGNRKP